MRILHRSPFVFLRALPGAGALWAVWAVFVISPLQIFFVSFVSLCASVVKSPYDEAYFAVQEAKSDAKVAWEYERLLALGDIRLAPGACVLDAACGAAPGLRFFHARGYRVVGSDIADAALRAALRFVPDVPLVKADLDRPQPFADRSFDLIILREAIEHVRDGAATLRECHRIVRPGGCVALTTPNRWDARRPLYRVRGKAWSGDADPTHTHIYSPPEMHETLRAAGFATIRVCTGYKPAARIGGRRVPLHVVVPYPPKVGNTIAAFGWREDGL